LVFRQNTFFAFAENTQWVHQSCTRLFWDTLLSMGDLLEPIYGRYLPHIRPI
jgi:hypothetical protein